MKRVCISIVLLLSILSVSCGNQAEGEFPVLEGPYLGQKPPGMTAEPFAPGVISKEGWELEGVFAPGMNEFYFTTRRNEKSTVIGFRQENNVWAKYLEFPRSGEVTFSPDGKRMHMAKGYKDRIGDEWSERKSLGDMFDREDLGIMRLSASANGTYVFDDYKSGDVIRISTLRDGKRQEPEEMGAVVNTGEWTAHPFIAPDESYLIWDSERDGGYGDSDLYISFRQMDGSWGPAINMGDKVNSDKWDAYASVTSDGKYILFNRGIDDDNDNVDIYWVDAQIIETLRSKSPDVKERYLGQEPPGLTPEIFAPGIVNTEKNREIEGMFAADMKAFYFIRRPLGEESSSNVMIAIRYQDDQLQESIVQQGETEPSVAPDGKRLYFKYNYMERTNAGWSELKSLGAPFEDIDIMRLSASANGTYYFDTFTKELDTPLRYSRLINGEYEQPKSLGPQFAVGTYNAHPFIAPDESYIVWDSRRESGYGTSDLYVSFRDADGSWGPAINLGDKINTASAENYPSISPDGKYLFFDRRERPANGEPSVDIFWVSAQFLETLKPE